MAEHHFTYLLHGAESFLRSYHFSASQEIPSILWNPEVHYRIHKCPPPAPILSHINLVQAPPSHVLKTHFNSILQSTPGPTKWSRTLRFPHLKSLYTSSLPHTCYMPSPPHSSRFDHPINTRWGVQIIKPLIMYFSPFPCYLIHLRPKYSPQHPILKGTAVAQWLRCCATNRKVADSIPDSVTGIFHWHNSPDRTMALGSTQPLTEMSTRRIS
jgi:hypothetical protein